MPDRLWLAMVGLLIAGSQAEAAPEPVPRPVPTDRQTLRAEAKQFARQLRALCNQIATNYIREIRREELLEAGLRGVYEAARCQPPRDLGSRIRQAVSLASLLEGSRSDAALGGGSLACPIEPLLEQLREQIGQPPALAEQNALIVACKAISRLLDPHSGLVTAQEQRRSVGLDQECEGIGLEFDDPLGLASLRIERVQAGSPAQRAGLRPGDLIVEIDGQAVAKASPAQVLALQSQPVQDEGLVLARPGGAEESAPALPRMVRVVYRRGESAPRSAELFRERYRPETVLGVRRRDDNRWNYLLDEKEHLACIRLSSLSRGSADQLREVVKRLRDHGMRGLILDLRWCPGGYLNEAVAAADTFLGQGIIASVRYRNRPTDIYRSTAEGKLEGFPLVVLINHETSGGAELIAAALQDHRRAVLIGQRTLGKGSVQTPISLGLDGIGFKLTSGTFLRASGKNLHRWPDSQATDDWGVRPDEEVRISPELSHRYRTWWLLQTLRPARDTERLPLDDPQADIQQQAALRLLRKLAAPSAR